MHACEVLTSESLHVKFLSSHAPVKQEQARVDDS